MRPVYALGREFLHNVAVMFARAGAAFLIIAFLYMFAVVGHIHVLYQAALCQEIELQYVSLSRDMLNRAVVC